MSEPQAAPELKINFEEAPVDPTPAEPQANEAGSESAPDNTPKPEAVKFDEEQQKLVDKLLGQKVFKQREAEREAEKLKQKIAELEAKIPQQVRPNVPDLPDPLAHDDAAYRKLMAERDDSLRHAAAFDAQEDHKKAQQKQLAQQQEQERLKALDEKVQSYSAKAATLGIKTEELQVAGNIVHQFGMAEDLVQYILADDHGPLITQYLSRNLPELELIARMSPLDAAARIATQIKPKAVALKPKVSNAPDPLDQPRGNGAQAQQRGPKGATYE